MATRYSFDFFFSPQAFKNVKKPFLVHRPSGAGGGLSPCHESEEGLSWAAPVNAVRSRAVFEFQTFEIET